MGKATQPLYSQLKEVEDKYPDRLLLKEIFHSIQGEGSLIGVYTTFIRFAGCQLQCNFCDTDFSFEKALTVEEVVNIIEAENPRYCNWTGGEPLINKKRIKQITRVIDELDENIIHTVETNGLVPLTKIEQKRFDLITISPKFDYYGGADKPESCAQFIKNDYSKVQIKFVIDTAKDLVLANEFLNAVELLLDKNEAEEMRHISLVFQPCWKDDAVAKVSSSRGKPITRHLGWDEKVQETFDRMLLVKEFVDEAKLNRKFPLLRILPQLHKYLELR